MIYNILIGGAAGQGMDSLSIQLAKTLKKNGLYVYLTKDYMSRVRGGHNFIQIRFSSKEIFSHHSSIDIIVALNQETIDFHQNRLKPQGFIIGDASLKSNHKGFIAIDINENAKSLGNPKLSSSIALGALLKTLNISLDTTNYMTDKPFGQRSNQHIEAVILGYNLANIMKDLNCLDSTEKIKSEYILINGNQSIALGAIAGGVGFYSAYPMAPSTGIMNYLSKNQREAKIVVEQAEDEIAAINMAIGASYTGVRSMTGTSGGGFSLMVEALGLSAITETPLVIVDVQRPGPATGLATRTEQSDLSFVLTASQGEFPRMIIAPRDAEDAFFQTIRALNLADQYQIPVILLSDQYLADCTKTVKAFDLEKAQIHRHILDPKNQNIDEKYKRYAFTENGVSPRLIPGKVNEQIVLDDSHEHNEYGNICEDIEIRIKMMEKRMKKLDYLKDDLQEPLYIGTQGPDILLIGWGSTYGPLKEAITYLIEDDIAVGALVFSDIYPLPVKLLEQYSKVAKHIINVEQNYTGQLAKLIKQETSISCNKSILKFDGRQLEAAEIYTKVKEMI